MVATSSTTTTTQDILRAPRRLRRRGPRSITPKDSPLHIFPPARTTLFFASGNEVERAAFDKKCRLAPQLESSGYRLRGYFLCIASGLTHSVGNWVYYMKDFEKKVVISRAKL